MYRNKLSHIIAVFALILAITVCMSGCKDGRSDTGEAVLKKVSKIEYSESRFANSSEESPVENSATESEGAESNQATDTPVTSSEVTTEPTPPAATETQTHEREEDELPGVDPFA